MAMVLFCLCFSVAVKAEDSSTSTIVEQQLDMLHLEALDESTKQMIGEEFSNFSFSEIVKKGIRGELKFSPKFILIQGLKYLFREISNQLYFIQKLILIAILSAVLKNLNASFQGKSVGELSFYICYIVLLVLIIGSFQVGIGLVAEVCSKMVSFMEAMLPIFTTLMFSSGNYTQLAFIGPVVIGAAGFLSMLIQNAVLPAIIMATTLHMVNFLSERNLLNQLSELLKNIISWGLKGISIAFMAMISLQRLGSPMLNKMIGKTAKVAVGAVPVVGDVMSGAVELAAAMTGAISNSIAAASIIVLIILCMVPLIKLVAMIFIYKVTAAILEPICEGRLIKCMSAAGDFSVLLLSALFTIEVMFIFSVMVLLSTA